MINDPRFNPIILICPVIDCGYNHMVETLRGTQMLFKKRGYNVINAYDESTGKYIDIKSLKPDILFFSSQWNEHVDKRFSVYSLRKYLKCYVNYSFKNTPYDYSIASQFQGLMWHYFSECEDNKQLALSFNQREFKNITVVGYPTYDEFSIDLKSDDDWKINSREYKRVIWAPHHSIDGNDGIIKLSTFLLYSEDMKEIATKYQDHIQFAFKPHPQLKVALYHHPNWGKEKTDSYFEWWATQKNTVYISGPYVNLFKSSDAMIHDCGSFIIEYLYTQKPVMFLSNYDREAQSNAVGKKAFACHYHGTSRLDIERFIENVVLNEQDTMIDTRKQFYDSVLVPPGGLTVAQNIINRITSSLKI